MRIWKFEIKTGYSVLNMHAGAVIRHFDWQNNRLWIWAEVSPDAPNEQRNFYVVGTGQEIPADATYIGTSNTGLFVWHLYSVSTKTGI